MNNIQTKMQSEITSKALFEQAKTYAYAYMDTIAERDVFPDQETLQGLVHFDEPLPQTPQQGRDILAMLHQYGSPATVAQIDGRYFGFVNGSALPTAMAVRWLADTWDQNAGLFATSPIAAQLEKVCEQWLVDLLQLPQQTVAGFVSGTSTATMCGLVAARNALLERQGWDVNADGLFGAPPIRVVLSDQAHGTVFKALSLIGLGKNRIERVPADTQGRIDARQMPPLDAHTILILQAGNVNSGAFDDFATLCEQANQAGAWVHVDGAFGLWAAAAKNRQYLTQGSHQADSWSVDGHKTLNTPYDCGIILCKHKNALVSAMQASGDYLQFSENRDNMLFVPEMSRRARGVELWASLKYLGRSGVDELVEGLCLHAAYFADRLRAAEFRILNDVVFNQVLVTGASPAQTQTMLAHIQQSGVMWCGGTTWQGEPAIRLSICSWATTTEDIDRSVKAFIQARISAESK